MKCNMNCFNCEFDDCIRDENQDVNEQKAEWIKNNPDKRKSIRRRYYLNHSQNEKDYQKNRYNELRNNPTLWNAYLEKKRIQQRDYRERKKRERQAV